LNCWFRVYNKVLNWVVVPQIQNGFHPLYWYKHCWKVCFSNVMIDWLIIYCFTSRSRIFHLYGDVTIAGEGLQI
jgi:hypothetical protein